MANIAFTGDYSLEARFDLINITELIVIMTIYGYDQFDIPLNFTPILVPQYLITESNESPKFGVGFRQENDELVYFATKTSSKTNATTNHTLSFTAEIEHYITYVSFTVDVSF